MPNVAAATKHFPTASRTFTDNLSGTVLANAVTIPVNSAAEYSNGEAVVWILAPGTADQVTVSGVINGNQAETCIWTDGTPAASYPAGTTVVDYVSATHLALYSKGLQVQHNQDGTHKAITAPSGTFSGSVSVGDDLTVTDDATFGGDVAHNGLVTEGGVASTSFRDEMLSQRDFCVSGGIFPTSANLTSIMTALVCYVDGKRISISATSKSFTASKDTYVDVNPSGSGALVYTEVANGAAAPALLAGYYRLNKVVTSGTAVTSVVSTGWDSLGNPIRRISPFEQVLGFYQATNNINIASAAVTQMSDGGTNVQVTVVIPAGVRYIEASFVASGNINNSNPTQLTGIYDTTVGGTNLGAVQHYMITGSANVNPAFTSVPYAVTPGATKTFVAGGSASAGTSTWAGVRLTIKAV